MMNRRYRSGRQRSSGRRTIPHLAVRPDRRAQASDMGPHARRGPVLHWPCRPSSLISVGYAIACELVARRAVRSDPVIRGLRGRTSSARSSSIPAGHPAFIIADSDEKYFMPSATRKAVLGVGEPRACVFSTGNLFDPVARRKGPCVLQPGLRPTRPGARQLATRRATAISSAAFVEPNLDRFAAYTSP